MDQVMDPEGGVSRRNRARSVLDLIAGSLRRAAGDAGSARSEPGTRLAPR